MVAAPAFEWTPAETLTGLGIGVAVGRGVGVGFKLTVTDVPDGFGSVSGVVHPVFDFVNERASVVDRPRVE